MLVVSAAALIRGNRNNCTQFSNNLDWLVSKLERLESSSGTHVPVYRVYVCVRAELLGEGRRHRAFWVGNRELQDHDWFPVLLVILPKKTHWCEWKNLTEGECTYF